MANARKVRCIETGDVYSSYAEAGRAIGVNISSVRKVVLGEQESVKGFHFEVVEENTREEEGLTLTLQNKQGELIPVLDSREVARMMGKKHKEILVYIEGAVYNNHIITGILPTLQGEQITSTDYFIESSYTRANNRKEKCYLCTRMGCDLLATRQNGEKGILFCAKYVKRFKEMEEELKNNNNPSLAKEDELILSVVKGATPLDRATALQEYTALITDKATAPLKAELEEQQPKVELADERLSMDGCISITDANKTFGLGQGKLVEWARNKGFIDKRKYIKEVNQAGRKYFKVYQTGKYRNIGITEEGMKLIKENKKEINSIKLHRNRNRK